MDKRVNSTDGTKVGPLTIIDFILAWVIAYNVVKGGIGFSFNADWNFTSFQSLVLGFAAAWAFVMLMFMPVIGLLIRGGFSLAYTFIICNIIPFSRWVNDSMLWLVPIYVIVFILCFSLHGASEMDSMPLEKFKEKREQSRIKKANKQAEKMMKNLYYQKSNTAGGNYRNPEEEQRKRQYEIEHAKTGDFRDMVLNPFDTYSVYVAAKESDVMIKVIRYSSSKIRVEVLTKTGGDVREENAVYKIYDTNSKEFADRLNYLKEKYNMSTCSRFSNLAMAQEWKVYIENTQNEGASDYDYQRRQQEQQAYEQQRRQQEERRQQQEQQSKSQDDGYDESLFAGCNDLESLKKRYRELMKIYHTDNPHGDLQKTQCIQNTYDKLAAMYN